jgi:hypothetical protein
MRCPYGDCETVFHYNPAAAQTPVQEGPAPPGDQAGYDLMTDLLTDDDEPAPVSRISEGPGHGRGVASGPLPAGAQAQVLPRLGRSGKVRQPVAGNPLAQASERSKEKLIGGKGVRFNEPRTYTGILIGFLILCVGYGAFWTFKYFMDEANNAAKLRADEKAKQIADADVKKKQRMEELIKKVATNSQPVQPSSALAARAPASSASASAASPPAPATTANATNLLIDLESAQLGSFRPGDPRQFLRIVLKVTNQSKVADHAATWPGTGVKLSLRDFAFQSPPLVENRFENKTLKAGEVIQQTVFFERPPLGADLTLELRVPDRLADKAYKVSIPAAVIQRGP